MTNDTLQTPKKSIVWLASYPKSGNTWMRLFLESLLRDSDQPPKLNERFSYVGLSDMAPEIFIGLAKKQLGELSSEEVIELRAESHNRLSNMAKPVVLVKTHAPDAEVFGKRIFFSETTLKAIYIVRNPLDIVESYSDHMGCSLADAITKMADPQNYMMNWTREKDDEKKFVNDYISSWSINVNSWVAKPRFPTLVLRYEDMLSSPFTEFSKVVKFLGAPFNDEQIKRAIGFSDFRALKKQEEEKGFLELSKESQSGSFFRRGKANRWRKVLSPKQAKQIMADHKGVMDHFGYPTTY